MSRGKTLVGDQLGFRDLWSHRVSVLPRRMRPHLLTTAALTLRGHRNVAPVLTGMEADIMTMGAALWRVVRRVEVRNVVASADLRLNVAQILCRAIGRCLSPEAHRTCGNIPG